MSHRPRREEGRREASCGPCSGQRRREEQGQESRRTDRTAVVQHQYLSIREISQTTSLSGIFSLRDLFPRAVGRILNNGRRFRLGDSTLLRPQVRFRSRLTLTAEPASFSIVSYNVLASGTRLLNVISHTANRRTHNVHICVWKQQARLRGASHRRAQTLTHRNTRAYPVSRDFSFSQRIHC